MKTVNTTYAFITSSSKAGQWDEFSPYSSRDDCDEWVSSTGIEVKLQWTQRPRRTQRSLGEESEVNFELKEFASTPADDRNEFAKIYLLACFQVESTLWDFVRVLMQSLREGRENRPFATSDHVVQNPSYWRASSLLFPHWDIKTKRPEPVKLDLPLQKAYSTHDCQCDSHTTSQTAT